MRRLVASVFVRGLKLGLVENTSVASTSGSTLPRASAFLGLRTSCSHSSAFPQSVWANAKHSNVVWHSARQCTQEQLRSLLQRWQQIETRAVTLANAFFCNSSGQKLLAVGVPLLVREFWGTPSAECSTFGPRPLTLDVQQLQLSNDSIGGVLHILLEELLTALRGVYLLFLFLPVLLTTPFVLATNREREQWLELVRWTLEQAGPAFIKWGQWAATRPDLFPPDMCTVLEQLQSSAPAHSYDYTVRTIEAAFGSPIHELFSSFSQEPVASGSIAQVYKAALSDKGALGTGCEPGTVVAVKVRHPGVQNIMYRDFSLMWRAAWLSAQLPGLSDLRLDESIAQFGAPLKEQLDLVREANHLARFIHNFRLWSNLSFPTPIFPLVSSDVLVESFEEGRLISTFVKNPGKHTKPLADLGLNCYLKMLLKDNFIHADLHPGNILVRFKDGKTLVERIGQWLKRERLPHLVLLDVGMIAELRARDKDNLLRFFKAITSKDGRGAADCILNFTEEQTCPDPHSFIHDVGVYMDSLSSEYITKYTTEVISEVLDRVRRHQVQLQGTISTVVVTTMVLEGWSTKLNPDIKIMETIKELLPMGWSERVSRTVDKIISHRALPSTA